MSSFCPVDQETGILAADLNRWIGGGKSKKSATTGVSIVSQMIGLGIVGTARPLRRVVGTEWVCIIDQTN